MSTPFCYESMHQSAQPSGAAKSLTQANVTAAPYWMQALHQYAAEPATSTRLTGQDAVWLANAVAEGLMARGHVTGLPCALAPSLAMALAKLGPAPSKGSFAMSFLHPEIAIASFMSEGDEKAVPVQLGLRGWILSKI